MQFEAIPVTTEDGYINELWHVWNNDTKRDDLLPIYFQHGLIDTAGTWFFNTPDKAPAYQLAHKGYDLWLGNNRGQKYSFKSDNMTTYWNHTFHEMGLYDQPAFQKEVLNRTGKEQLIYVGHSQGTIQFWLANILHPYEQYGKHVKAMVACAPVMYLTDMKSVLMETLISVNADLTVPRFTSQLFVMPDH